MLGWLNTRNARLIALVMAALAAVLLTTVPANAATGEDVSPVPPATAAQFAALHQLWAFDQPAGPGQVSITWVYDEVTTGAAPDGSPYVDHYTGLVLQGQGLVSVDVYTSRDNSGESYTTPATENGTPTVRLWAPEGTTWDHVVVNRQDNGRLVRVDVIGFQLVPAGQLIPPKFQGLHLDFR